MSGAGLKRAVLKAPGVSALISLAACGSSVPLDTPITAAPLPFPPWQSQLLRDHELVGRIWLTKEKRFTTAGELVRRMALADYIALGETHDNPDHHRIQAWVTDALINTGERPALVMEMFMEEQQQAIDGHLKAQPGDSAGLGSAAGWQGNGWPAWREYEPIVRPIVKNGLPLIAANISRGQIRDIHGKGFKALDAEKLKALGLTRPIDEPLLAAMDREIADAHCGMVEASRARPFTRIQAVRDATFADAMVRGARAASGAILIAGAGHVRTDRGVPYHLRRAGREASDIFSLGIIEVAEGETQPAAYGKTYGVEILPFDAVWFTPRSEREDPCLKFKKRNKNK